MLPHCLPPNTIAFLAEFVPNSFKNQSNDEISIEKLHRACISGVTSWIYKLTCNIHIHGLWGSGNQITKN